MKKRKPHPMMVFKSHKPTGSSNKFPPPGIPNNAKVYRRVNGMLIETDKAGNNRVIQQGDK